MRESAFASKSEAKQVKTLLGAEPKNDLETVINIWPSGANAFGVAIRLSGKGLQARLCADKAAIIKYLDEVL